ncbi:hypothetical protein Adt_17840 [Abeliophyllum distichum]|uniref:Uncharacterized protein n=1 Tax=Abeliophyllum distichum TaxID=126358 RepID=A0ABD1TID7_9LAMI
MSAKRSRREKTPLSSSEEDVPQMTRIDCCPVLISKNVDLASFTFDAASFHIEDLFSCMGWSKEFDDELGPSTLLFEDGEEIDDDEEEDEPPPRPRSQRLSSSTFGFTEDHFNLLNGRIDSLTSSVEGLRNRAEDLHRTMETLQHSVYGMITLLQALHFRLDTVFPPHPLPEN